MRSITAWSGCSALVLGLIFALSACTTKETSSRTTEQTIDQTEKGGAPPLQGFSKAPSEEAVKPDRKSTRLNSSHSQISYAVFCLKKKKNQQHTLQHHQQPSTQNKP